MAAVARSGPIGHLAGSAGTRLPRTALDVQDATVIANDTAGGLLLLSLGTGHPALERLGRLVLSNCESYDKFPPDALKKASVLARKSPRLSRLPLRLQLRPSIARRKIVSTVAASRPDHDRDESFFQPARDDTGVADDLIAAMAGFRPQLLIDAAQAIPHLDRPVLLILGDSCDFVPITDAQRLASKFPNATLIPIPGAKTWTPIDNPAAVSDAISNSYRRRCHDDARA